MEIQNSCPNYLNFVSIVLNCCTFEKAWKTFFFFWGGGGLAYLTSLYIHVHYLHNSALQETLVFHQPKSFPASACTLSIDLQLIHTLQVTPNIHVFQLNPFKPSILFVGADPDQMRQNGAPDQDLYCLLTESSIKILIKIKNTTQQVQQPLK